jgi:hypothetical protein
MKLSHLCARFIGTVVLFPVSSVAHHAFAGVFDMDNVTELKGAVTEILWRNPHVRFSVSSEEGEVWKIQTNSVSILHRMDITPELMSVGDSITVAGFKARNGRLEMWTNNVMLSDGREVVMRPGVAPYWADSTLGTSEIWLAEGSATNATDAADLGLFRVWSTHFTGPSRSLFQSDLPLTPGAAAARAAFGTGEVVGVLGDCIVKGMPMIMAQPYPVQFVDQGDVVLFEIEEYDAVRTIFMDPDADIEMTPTRLGRSKGRWVGEELHVTTTNIDWPYFDGSGVPQSEAMELYERFSVNEDGSRLNYHLTATDASTFTRPVDLNKAWMWRPGEIVRPYECTPSE